ncbi:uncharacterized protein LY89DRAFT_728732 [Mollisia scopiformis]|uniref:BTB domain-containing protein n=1 Tax=Mollisia scopiformis TaxID=149040 RepID=A0A194XQQ8_MOLSC|nr:uncharacterized protein LY89DRAFT_728732 [Mollisia scopiformis]KUJ22610.1 hypothetical protein LY89DRAFT_728732 [Mollisia scopiformis]
MSSSTGAAENSKRRDNKPLKRPDMSDPNTLVKLTCTAEGEDYPFTVHKEYACFHSSVLNRAFNSDFIEGQNQEYKFDEAIPRYPIKLLVQWLYQERCKLVQQTEGWGYDMEVAEREKIVEEEDMGLVQLWVLAQFLIMPKLQDWIMDGITAASFYKAAAPTNTFPWVYDNTEVGSPLRKVMVLLSSAYLHSAPFRENSQHYPHEMLVDLLMYQQEQVAGTNMDAYEAIREVCYFWQG